MCGKVGGCPELTLTAGGVKRVGKGEYELGERVEDFGLLEVGEGLARWRGWEERRFGGSGTGFGRTECGGREWNGGCLSG